MSDPRRNECVMAALSALEEAGLKGRVELRAKHIAIVWTDDEGEKTYITASTPSDRRAPINTRADVRRMVAVAKPAEELRPAVIFGVHGVTTNSRSVAEHFERQHSHVLRAIDDIVKSMGNLDYPILDSPFRVVMQPDASGIMRRSFDMTRDGFVLLAMGFQGERALKWKMSYIALFNAMEAVVRPSAQLALSASDSSATAALRGDLDALTDIVLSLPSQASAKIRKPRFVRPSLIRRQRRMLEASC